MPRTCVIIAGMAQWEALSAGGGGQAGGAFHSAERLAADAATQALPWDSVCRLCRVVSLLRQRIPLAAGAANAVSDWCGQQKQPTQEQAAQAASTSAARQGLTHGGGGGGGLGGLGGLGGEGGLHVRQSSQVMA